MTRAPLAPRVRQSHLDLARNFRFAPLVETLSSKSAEPRRIAVLTVPSSSAVVSGNTRVTVMRLAISSVLVCILSLNITSARPASAGNITDAAPEVPNQNTLITAHLDKLKFHCSTQWAGWPPERAFDGDPTTSWFTARGDAAAHGRTPWLEVEFPADVTIRRITLHANREPPWQVGYTIRVGRLECFDAQNKVVYEKSGELGGKTETIEFRPPQPIATIRRIRFTSLQDDGDKNPYDDIALGEMFVE